MIGARIGNTNLNEAQIIAGELNQIDKKIIRRENILYEYLANRSKKDKSDNDKQIEKAQYYLKILPKL